MTRNDISQWGFSNAATKNLALAIITLFSGTISFLWYDNSRLYRDRHDDDVKHSQELQKCKNDAYAEMKGYFNTQIEALQQARKEQDELRSVIQDLKQQTKRMKK